MNYSRLSAVQSRRPRVARIGIVGLGPMGIRHLQACAQVVGAAQVVVALRHSRDEAVLAGLPLGAQVDRAPWSPDFAKQCDLVVVAVQTELHAQVAAEIAAPRLIEKPLCQSPEQAIAVLAQPWRTFVGHSSRAEAGAMALHRALQTGAVGQVRHIKVDCRESQLLRPAAGRPQQVGRLFDVAVHALATVADALPAQPPSMVWAELEAGEGDQLLLRGKLQWAAGPSLAVQVQPDRNSGREVVVSGSEATLSWQVAPGRTELVQTSDGVATVLACGGPSNQVSLVSAVVDALASGQPSPFDGGHGLRVLQWTGQLLAAAGPFEWDWVR